MGRQYCRHWHRVVLAGTIVLCGLAARSPAEAQALVFNSQFNGLTAEASFTGYDPATESWTEVSLYALDGRRRLGNGGSVPTSTLWVQLAKIDPRTGFRWLDGFAFTELPAPAFQIDPALGKASLKTTVQLYDFSSGTQLPLTLELTWTGDGERKQSAERSHYRGEDFLFHYRHLGFSRSANASGAFSLGEIGAEALGTTSEAALFSVRDGYLELYR